MESKKKLIEVALPLEEINAASAREKSIRHGHPSTLHLWWARRPLAAARAVIWSSLVDDPSAHPDQFPTEEAKNIERERLFDILRELVLWENSNNKKVLDAAKAEIMKSTNGNPPALLDPFAGGGSIPLEAQRLGLEAHASDLNPVAVMINKAMIEIPPKFAGQPPVNPESNRLINDQWTGASGLAEDVRYYGEWMKQQAWEKIGHLYPKVKDEHGIEHTVIAWIWARTVKCPNPACGCEMPLVSSFELSKRKGKETYIQPIIEGTNIRYEVKQGKNAPEGTIIRRRGAKCICCGAPIEFAYIRDEGTEGRISAVLLAIVGEAQGGRVFLSPNKEQVKASMTNIPDDVPESETPHKALGINVRAYGFNQYKDLFSSRQLNTLTSFINLIPNVKFEIENAGGTDDYARAICTYLAFSVDKIADRNSTFSGWDISRESLRNTFAMQNIQMSWDYAESNPFSNSAGCWDNAIDWIVRVLKLLPASIEGDARQADAQHNNLFQNVMVSTDPPYYDNIGYADLSDFFYVWLRQSLKGINPDLFHTMLVPKTEELVANPFKFEGSRDKARLFFEDGMLETFRNINRFACEHIPVTVYYAFKQTDTNGSEGTASTGWETMLSAMIEAGFALTGTWPLRTELANRSRGVSSNALASSIVLVCRKRPADAPTTTRRDFINTLKRELKPALQKLQASNIAPVDMAQAAIGPGMGVYSRYAQVLEADGTPMSVRTALQLINQELDVFFNEQDGELDRESRFCVELYSQAAFNQIKFGEADVLARAKNTSVDGLAQDGLLLAEKGIVRLLTREELPSLSWTKLRSTWMLTQQLTKAMESGGNQATAAIIATLPAGSIEHAKALAYRLFSIAERKGWAKEAFAYNALVNAWKDVQTSAAEIAANAHDPKQGILFDT